MKRTLLTAAALAFTVVGASSAQAQALRPISFGMSGGAAIPMGKTADAANMGFGLTGLADYKTPTMPVSLRGELSFSRFGMKDLPSDIDGNHRVLAAIVNVVANVGGNSSVSPYIIAGPGVYSLKSTMSQDDIDVSFSKTAMGINGGMGLNFHLGALSTFAEARYHYVFSKDDDKGFDNTQNLPIVFGIRF